MMVGIVAILLLASLAWSAVGALFGAIGAASSVLTASRQPPTLEPAVAATPPPVIVSVPAPPPPTTPTPTPEATLSSTPQPTVGPTKPPAPTATPEVAARNPWILLPQPAPGSSVTAGSVTVEARGRGDVPITTIRLELDGAALPVSIEQRSESTWRGFATTRVTPGEHAVRAVVTDADGRSGSFRWNFSAGS